MTAGRPPGHVRLMDDPRREETAAWLAFTEAGLRPYEAANWVTFLLASEKPITTESIDGLLLISSTRPHTTPKGHADRVRRKAEEVMERDPADDDDNLGHLWLTQSAGLFRVLLKCFFQGDRAGFLIALDMLRFAGWTDTILRVSRRIDASLQSNFPPHQDKLSRTAKRMLRQMQERTKK
jgi:hypothetical protein